MPRKYSFARKAAALVQIERNRGDIPYTASQLGISVRTLREWHGGIQAWLLPPPSPQRQNTAEIPAFDDDLESLAFIRKRIIDQMMRLSMSFDDDPAPITLALSRLVDKLMKLDLHLKPYTPAEMVVRVVRVETPLPDQSKKPAPPAHPPEEPSDPTG